MTAFMEFLSSNELTIVIVLMVVVFILIMTILMIDVLSKQRDNTSFKKDDFQNKELENTSIQINQDGFGMIADEEAVKNIDISNINKNLERTQEIEEIKYVEEDEELEKTKALLELETLKKELAKMEEAQSNPVSQPTSKESLPTPDVLEKVEPVIEILEQPIEESASSLEQEEKIEEVIMPEIKMEPQNEISSIVPTIEDEVNNFEMEQEENAIISVEELTKASMTITDEEIEKYEDDGNEPISLKELEELYKSVEEEEEKPQMPEVKPIPTFEMDTRPAEEVYEDKSFKTTPVISPVFGMKPTESSILLEQTANLDKLNEEIRKTNEFLSALKELRKNLE